MKKKNWSYWQNAVNYQKLPQSDENKGVMASYVKYEKSGFLAIWPKIIKYEPENLHKYVQIYFMYSYQNSCQLAN